jgi:DNA mismatch endonuclease, patch repair protein
MGLRYRVNQRIPDVNVVVRPDLVFASKKVCIFVDGCFWHRCPIHATQPKSNAGYWREKLAKNVARDRRANRALEANGWTVIRFWEHEDPQRAAEKIAGVLRRER